MHFVIKKELREILGIFSDLVKTVRSQSRSQELRAILARYVFTSQKWKSMKFCFVCLDGRIWQTWPAGYSLSAIAFPLMSFEKFVLQVPRKCSCCGPMRCSQSLCQCSIGLMWQQLTLTTQEQSLDHISQEERGDQAELQRRFFEDLQWWTKWLLSRLLVFPM